MTTNYGLKDVTKTNQIREAFGEEIILFDEQEESTVFTLLSEFTIGEQTYAVLQSEELKKDDEVAIFKVGKDSQGNIELETIEDDDEWENVAELYDEMTLSYGE